MRVCCDRRRLLHCAVISLLRILCEKGRVSLTRHCHWRDKPCLLPATENRRQLQRKQPPEKSRSATNLIPIQKLKNPQKKQKVLVLKPVNPDLKLQRSRCKIH